MDILPFPRAFLVRRCGQESSRSCRARRPRGPGSNAHVFRNFGRIRSNARPPHVGAGVPDGPAGTGKIRIILGESAKRQSKRMRIRPNVFAREAHAAGRRGRRPLQRNVANSPEGVHVGRPCCGTSGTTFPTKRCFYASMGTVKRTGRKKATAHVGAGVLDGPAGTGKIRIILGESAKRQSKRMRIRPNVFA